MPTIDDLYHRAATTPSESWEHMPFLMRLGCMVDHITEFGTHTWVSTAL